MIRIDFVFDIDGTLCFNGKTIDQAIVGALHKLLEDGHSITFASARPIRDLVPVLPERFKAGKLVGGNGCFISNNGQITASSFTPELMDNLHTIINKHKLTYLADGEWDYSFTGSKDHPIYQNINQDSAVNIEISKLQKVCKLVLFNPTDAAVENLRFLPVNITAYKNENAIDISPIGINKVSGLKQLSIDDFIAFGNDSNDQCLFESAQFSVCVGQNDVRKFASITIEKENITRTILELSRNFQ